MWIKVIWNCNDCGNTTEAYGPFETAKEAEDFEYPPSRQNDTISHMTCTTERILELRK